MCTFNGHCPTIWYFIRGKAHTIDKPGNKLKLYPFRGVFFLLYIFRYNISRTFQSQTYLTF